MIFSSFFDDVAYNLTPPSWIVKKKFTFFTKKIFSQ